MNFLKGRSSEIAAKFSFMCHGDQPGGSSSSYGGCPTPKTISFLAQKPLEGRPPLNSDSSSDHSILGPFSKAAGPPTTPSPHPCLHSHGQNRFQALPMMVADGFGS